MHGDGNGAQISGAQHHYRFRIMAAASREMRQIVRMALMDETRFIESFLLDRIGYDRGDFAGKGKIDGLVYGSDHRGRGLRAEPAGVGLLGEGHVDDGQGCGKHCACFRRNCDLPHHDVAVDLGKPLAQKSAVAENEERNLAIMPECLPCLSGDVGSDAARLADRHGDRQGLAGHGQDAHPERL